MADGAFDGFYALDGDMHGMLLSFTGFRRPALLADKVWVNVNRARRLVLPLLARVAEILAEHQTIAATLEQRDVDGAPSVAAPPAPIADVLRAPGARASQVLRH